MNSKTNEPKHEKRELSHFLPISKYLYEEMVEICEHHDVPIELVTREMVRSFVAAWNVTGRPHPMMVNQKLADMFRKQGEEESAEKHQQDFSKGWEE